MPTEIPNPPAWPIIGNTLDLLQSDSTAKLLARYGTRAISNSIDLVC